MQVCNIKLTVCKNACIMRLMETKVYATRLPGLKPLMRDRNISAVAKALDINPNTLWQIVNCKRGASSERATKIAAYFNTTVGALMTAPEEVAA
jgi:transposase-like protein